LISVIKVFIATSKVITTFLISLKKKKNRFVENQLAIQKISMVQRTSYNHFTPFKYIGGIVGYQEPSYNHLTIML